MKWRNLLIVALVTLPLVVVLALGFRRDPHEVPSVLPGKNGAACDLVAIDGGKATLAAYRGRPLVLNFWASWCEPCEAEHQALQQAARNTGDRVQFVGVVYQDEPEAARRYLSRNGSTYPQLLDPSSRCAIDYGVAGVPETFFLDASGRILDKHVGPLDPAGLAGAMAGLLGEKK